MACSSPFGSTYGLGRRPEVRQGGQGCPRTKPCSFQSPSGVLGVCRTRKRGKVQANEGVSVPFRGFRDLQGNQPSGNASTECQVSVPFRGFRGLRVSKCRQTWPLALSMFQSPSGVLGVCGPDRTEGMVSGSPEFQSPSGVLGVCGLNQLNQTGPSRTGGFSPLPGF